LRPLKIVECVLPAMQATPAQRPVDPGDGVVPDFDVRRPGVVLLRPALLKFFRAADFLEKTSVFRLGSNDLRPRLDGQRPVFLLRREIACVLIKSHRWLGDGAPPFFQRLLYSGKIPHPKLRLDEPVPGPIVLRFQL
jgi:hypothetical protein